MNLAGYHVFRQMVLKLTGIDLDGYKRTQMERRLAGFLRRTGVKDLDAYVTILRESPSRIKEFEHFLTINVSEWFRNPEKFDELQRLLLPTLREGRRSARIWSAGCSNGAEPYSIAALLHEVDPNGAHDLIATDVDEEILKVAATGIYGERDLQQVSGTRLAQHFERVGDRYVVRPHLRRHVRFMRHNLLSDPYPTELDVAVCRNVVIYFNDEAKERLYRGIHRALRPGGLLFVGGTESLLRAKELQFEAISPFFYRAVK